MRPPLFQRSSRFGYRRWRRSGWLLVHLAPDTPHKAPDGCDPAFWRCWSAHDPASERRAGMASDRSHRYEEGLCEFVVAGAGGAAPRSAVRTSVLLSWAPRRSVEGDLA